MYTHQVMQRTEITRGRHAPRPGDKVARGVALTLWGCHLLLAPFYFWDSGLPQPADIAIPLLFGVLIAYRGLKLPVHVRPVLWSISVFALWICLVNLVWTFLLAPSSSLSLLAGPDGTLWPCAYYLFNLMVCLTFGSLYDWFGTRIIKWTIVVAMLGLCSGSVRTLYMSVFAGFATIEESTRLSLSYNNPNQLAAAAVTVGSIFAFCLRWNLLPAFVRRFETLWLLPILHLTIMTLSLAGICASGVIVVLCSARRWQTILVGLALAGGVAFAFVNSDLASDLSMRLRRRDRGLVEEASFRGYDRIWNHPEYLCFGAGEGVTDRFQTRAVSVTKNKTLELHSSLGTVIFCYGVVGLYLFLRPLGAIARRGGFSALVWFVPPALFGLAHNGLRQTEFWILLMIVACVVFERATAGDRRLCEGEFHGREC